MAASSSKQFKRSSLYHLSFVLALSYHNRFQKNSAGSFNVTFTAWHNIEKVKEKQRFVCGLLDLVYQIEIVKCVCVGVMCGY